MGYNFDGPNKLVILTAGTTLVDVDDMYSRWADWLVLSDNMKYLPAFRYVGGDSISDTKDLGVTFFITNGWRIRPQEADHRLNVNGNLYTDPSGFSPFVGTVGSFNVTIEMQVSSLVDSSLAQLPEIEQASYASKVTINVTSGQAGTAYPIGTNQVIDGISQASNNITDAKTIAASRGFDSFEVKGNLTIGATDNVTALKIYGEGATLNVFRTTVTLVSGCVTTNSQYYNCKITGYQGGESLYHDSIIDGLENAHCIYERCGLMDGTSRGWTIKQSSAVSSGHASYFKECYSDEGTAILDRNGARMNVTFDGWHGRLLIKNQNHATSSGQVWIHMNGGTLTVDATCTKGKITVTGVGILVNQSQGTEVDASGFTPELFAVQTLNLESLKQTHQGFGQRWFVDPVSGNDLAPGASPASPLRTLTAAIGKAVSGRGDVIYLLAPGTGTATLAERIVLNKEDVHIRGPGRGVQIQPTTPDSNTPIIDITANNCSLAGFIVRSNTSEVAGDAIRVSGKFSRMEKLYCVGPGQISPVNTCRGVVFTGGDYHELWDMEIEKYGDSGLELDDQSSFHSNGSPREISIFGGNIYLNGVHGLCLHGKTGSALGATSRLIRVLRGCNIHDNLSFGIHSEANVQGVVIDDSVLLHANNAGGDQVDLQGTGYFKAQDNALQSGSTVIEGMYTRDEILRLMAAVLNGKVSGAGTGVETFTGLDGVTDRVVSTVDTNGNRTNVVLNGV